MMPKGNNLVRLLWVLLLVVFLAALLPRTLGHPYPAAIESYIVYGGILIYVVGGLGIVALVRKSQRKSGK